DQRICGAAGCGGVDLEVVVVASLSKRKSAAVGRPGEAADQERPLLASDAPAVSPVQGHDEDPLRPDVSETVRTRRPRRLHAVASSGITARCDALRDPAMAVTGGIADDQRQCRLVRSGE